MKTVLIDFKKYKLELRYCLNARCTRSFSVLTTSSQSMCSIECWEVTNNKMWVTLGAHPTTHMRPIYPQSKDKKAEWLKEARARKKKIAANDFLGPKFL